MFSNFRNRFHSFKGASSSKLEERRASNPDLRKPDRNEYKRPRFLQLTESEYEESEDHETRPVIVPKCKTALPWNAGYAECVCTRFKRNEDQAAAGEIKLDQQLSSGEQAQHSADQQITIASLRGIFYGVFDGHGGSGAALMVADQLINHLQEKLVDVQNVLFELALKEKMEREKAHGDSVNNKGKDARNIFDCHLTPGDIRLDDLIKGALESAFHAMDEHIAGEKASFSISGGCCSLVALFICGKLYVANAGDSRAVAYVKDEVIPLSTDFRADVDEDRIYFLAHCRPELLNNMFTINRFPKTVHKSDIGQRMLYKTPLSSGWIYKNITNEDTKFQLVHGKDKGSRLMNCIGVSRCMGDHDLCDVYTKVCIKPFLSCTPEVQILDLRDRFVSDRDVLVLGSDGLWDMETNESTGKVIQTVIAENTDGNDHIYGNIAYKLVQHARGSKETEYAGWKKEDGSEASHDDITAIVIPLNLVASSTVVTLSTGPS